MSGDRLRLLLLGPDGWKTATAQGVTPDDVHFRWSPKHQDVEVISKNSLPVYLYAPGENRPHLLSFFPFLCSFLTGCVSPVLQLLTWGISC